MSFSVQLLPWAIMARPLRMCKVVFLSFELAARQSPSDDDADEDAPGDDDPHNQPPGPLPNETKQRRRIVGKQPPPAPSAPGVLQRHPDECVQSGNGRLSCSRCGRNVLRKHATAVRQFWESNCFANKGNVNLRAIARAASIWGKERQKQQIRVNQIAEEHGGPLIWAGFKYSPVRCLRCEWRQPLFLLHYRKSCTAPACPGGTAAAKRRA